MYFSENFLLIKIMRILNSFYKNHFELNRKWTAMEQTTQVSALGSISGPILIQAKTFTWTRLRLHSAPLILLHITYLILAIPRDLP